MSEWNWLLHDATGGPLAEIEGSGNRFPSQAEAEAWLGEAWPDLVDAGVSAVTLRQADIEVYGPMSLEPPEGADGSW